MIAIIGSGTWGTAMALLIGREHDCILWGRRANKIEAIAGGRHDQLGDIELPARLRCTADAGELRQATLLLWAVPTQHSRAIAEHLAPALAPEAPIVSLAKGIEREHLLTVTGILADRLGTARSYGALSGPSHAEEVMRGQPTGLVAAGPQELALRLVELLHGGNLRIYTSADLPGVELGGALKNVVAVAAGIAEGIELGDNAKAMLISRGLAEMRRLGRAMGADDRTFAGLAGVGDLLTTCYSPYGRNRALGLAIGRGETAEQYMRSSGMIAEGAFTCSGAVALGARHGVEVPLASAVESVVWHGTSVSQAIEQLMSRESKEEIR